MRRCSVSEQPSIKFRNLIEESRYAFEAGDFKRSELILAEAQVLVTHERRLKEMEGAA